MEGIRLVLICVCQAVLWNWSFARGVGNRNKTPLSKVHLGEKSLDFTYYSHQGKSLHSMGRRHANTHSASTNSAYLHSLLSIDPIVAQLEYIDTIRNTSSCPKDTNIAIPYPFAHHKFKLEANLTERLATMLSNYFDPRVSLKNKKSEAYYNNATFYSFAKFVVSHSHRIAGCGIAFDEDKYLNRKYFIPYAFRDHNDPEIIQIKDLAQVLNGSYTKPDNVWFWKVKVSEATKALIDKYTKRKENYTCIRLCRTAASPEARIKESRVQISQEQGVWSDVHYDCRSKKWLLSYSAPFISCSKYCKAMDFTGVVKVDIDLTHQDINQCEEPSHNSGIFAGSHKCHSTTECQPVKGKGFTRGSYQCHCKKGHFFKNPVRKRNEVVDYYRGVDIERSYVTMLVNHSIKKFNTSFQCLPCNSGCEGCEGNCPPEYDVLLRGIPLGIQSFCMTIALVLGFVVLRLRKTKVMKVSMWIMLEIIIFGALLLYSTVVIRYFESDTTTCLLLPWFREVGFAILYGALVLKVYRVLADFQSRKAHRVYVRDKDLLKYLACITLVVIGYMSAWTAINLDHQREGNSMVERPEPHKFPICKSFWWDYVVEVGEFLFLSLGLYICYCVRTAPSDYNEAKYISWALSTELIVSAVLHITRHIIHTQWHPDRVFLMYFVRCQLTVSVALVLVLGPKFWFTHRPPEDYRGRAYSTSEGHDSILPESMKLQVGVNSNGDVDVGEINLAEMDPEDIRAELKRLYTQLQIYKTKTMRKDNPHISKRRGGRKQTHRRLSLQAFHFKKSTHHAPHDHDHEHEMSRTPEESTNSAEGVSGISMGMESSIREEYSHCQYAERTPTVTFKPGHKTLR